MSKGNSRKGNREAKKPKKETPKVLATANTISNPTRLELGFKKGGYDEDHSYFYNSIGNHFNSCPSRTIQSKQAGG